MSSRWKKIETTRTVGEATLLQNALENEGVEVDLRGEHRPSIAGELPIPEAEVEIWVREADASRVQEVLVRLRQDRTDQRRCPGCGEENPGNFEHCWKCQASLEAIPLATQDKRAVENNAAASIGTQATGKAALRVGPIAMVLLALLAAGAGYILGIRSASSSNENGLTVSQWDSAGVCLEEFWRATKKRYLSSCDANRNGIYERISQYSPGGWLTSQSSDDNENGVAERVLQYGPGGKVAESIDADEDGVYENTIQYAPAGWVSGQSFDKNSSGFHERVLLYGPKGMLSEATDTDENGVFERQVMFGVDGGVISELFDEDQDGRHGKFLEHREQGVEVVWRDSQQDGVFELKEIYKDGALVRIEEDRGVEGFVAIPTSMKAQSK